MAPEELFIRRAVVCGSALIYWAGVLVQARRIRKRIGKSPNLKPRTRQEKFLWAGWMLVVLVWIAQPFLIGKDSPWLGLRMIPVLTTTTALAVGLVFVGAGYAGTLWCYQAMGSAWRIGINRKEKTALISVGPYRWVRHPIYVFQIVMLIGVAFLLPTGLSLLNLSIHFLCVAIKSAAEESYLRTTHGTECDEYFARTGRFLPRLKA
jgi:protein-S-isoprenylcysteine O-methyltransferase Ste14